MAQTTSQMTGPWNTGSTWAGGFVPAPGADVVIASGHVVTIDVNTDVNSLTIESGASLIVADATGPFTMNISGDLANQGTLTLLSGGGTGEVNVTFDNSTTIVISGSGTSTFNDLTIDGTGNIINVNAFTASGDFSVGPTNSNLSFTSNNTNLTFLGNFSLANTSSFSTSGSTTSFDGTSAQTIDLSGGSAEFNNIDFDGNSVKTINGNITTTGGTVQLLGTTSLTDQAPGNVHTLYNLEVNSTNALNLAGSTLNFQGGEIRFGDGVGDDGTVNIGAGAIAGDGTGDDVDIVLQTGNLQFERDDQFVMDGDLSCDDPAQILIQGIDPTAVTATELDATVTDVDGTHTLTLSTTGDLYPQGGDNFPTSFGTYSFGTNSIVRYNQAFDQVIRGEDDGGNLIPYADLLMNAQQNLASGITFTKTLFSGDDLSVAADLLIYGGSLFTVSHAANIAVGDDIVDNGSNEAFFADQSVITLNGTVGQTITALDGSGTYEFRSLIITNPSGLQRTVNIDNNITLIGASGAGNGSTFQIQNPLGDAGNTLIVDIDANQIEASSISSRFDILDVGANCEIFTSGSEFITGFDQANDNATFDVNSIVRFDSPNDQNIPAITGSYGSIEFNGNGDKYVPTGSTSLTILGDVTRAGGSFTFFMDQSGQFAPIFNYVISVSGNWSLGTAYTAVNQLVPTSNQTVSFVGADQVVSASNFDNITFGGSGTKTIQGVLNVNGDLALSTSGVTVTTSSNINMTGGNWSEVAGTVFQQNAATTTFSSGATQTITTQSSSYFDDLDVTNNTTLQLAGATDDFIRANDDFLLQTGSTIDLNGSSNTNHQDIRVGGDITIDGPSAVVEFSDASQSSIIMDGTIAQNFDNEVAASYPTLEFEGVGEKDMFDQTFNISGDFIVSTGTTVNGNGEILNFTGDNWTVNGNFLSTGTVNFLKDNAGGATTVSSSNFNNFVVGDGVTATTVDLSGNIALEANLTINDLSILNANNFNIQLEADWNGYGTFTPGTGTVTFIGNFSQIRTDDDTADGADDEDPSTAKAFYNLTVNNGDGQIVRYEDDEIQGGVLTILNDFTVESGIFDFNEDAGGNVANAVVEVGGDINFSGGTITYDDASTGTFTNTISLINNSITPETHSINLGGNIVRNFEIVNNEGDTYQLTNTFETQDDADDNFTLNAAGSTLDLNGQIMVINRGGMVMQDGTLEIDGGSSLVLDGQDLGSTTSFSKTGGQLNLVGTSESPAVLTSLTTAGFTFEQSGGDFTATNYTVAQTAVNGLNITGGTISDFSNGTFTNGVAGSTAYLTIQSGVAIGTISAPGVAFNAGPTFNVNTNINNDGSNVPTSGTIEFVIAGGTLSGEANENDDPDGGAADGYVLWTNDPGFTWSASAANSNWDDAANWTVTGGDVNGNGYPDEAADIVYIQSSTNDPQIDGSGDFNIGRLTISSGGLTINTGKLNIDGNVTVFGGSSLTLTQTTDSLKIAGSFANDGTFTQNNGKISFDGASGSHSINSASDFVQLNINGGTDAVYTLGSALTVTDDFTLTGGTFDGSSGFTFNIAGDWTVAGGIFNPGVGTVDFISSTSQDISGGTLFNADFRGTGTMNITGNISVGGEFEIDGDVVSAPGSAVTIFVGGDWNNDVGPTGFAANDGTVIFNGEGTQNIDAGTGTGFNNLTFQGTGARNVNDGLTVAGDLTIAESTVNITFGNTITGSGGTLLMSGGILDAEDTDNFPSGFGTYSLTGGLVRYFYNDNPQNVLGGIEYNNLELRSNNGGDNVTRTLLGDITVNGTLTLGQGNVTFEVGSNTLTLTGNNAAGTNHFSVGASDVVTFTGGGTLAHTGSNEWDIDADLAGNTFENMTFSGGRKDLLGSLTVNGNLTINSGVDFDQNTFDITNDGGDTFTLADNATYTNNSNNSLPTNFATYAVAATSTTTLNNTTADQSILATTYGNLSLNSNFNMNLAGNITVEGDFDMNSDGVLVDNNFDLTLNGDFVDIQDYTPSAASTITFAGADQNIVDNDGATDNLIFSNVVFGGSGTKTVNPNGADEFEVLNTLVINSDVTVTTPDRLRFRGTTLTNNGTLITTDAGDPFTFDGGVISVNFGTSSLAALELTNSSSVTLNTNGLDVENGDITIGDGSTLNFGSTTSNIASDDIILNTSGAFEFGAVGAESTLIFDRATGGQQRIPNIDATNNPTQITNIPNLTFAGTGQKLLQGSLLVNDITLESTITELDVSTNDYAIEVRGAWDNQGTSFDEQEGTVTFFNNNNASDDARTITTNDDQFANLIFDAVGNTFTRTYTLNGNLTVEGQGSLRGVTETALTLTRGILDLNGNELQLGNNDAGDPIPETSVIGADATLIVDEGAILSFSTDDDDGDNSNNLTESAILQVLGTLILDGTPGNLATFTRASGGDRIGLSISGTIEADNYSFGFLTDAGVQILSGASLASATTFSNGAFNNMSTTSGAARAYLDFQTNLGGGTFTIDNITFNYDGTPDANTINIRTNATVATTINLTNTAGTLGADGEAYDEDVVAVAEVNWPPVTTTTWTAGAGTNDWDDNNNWTSNAPNASTSAIIPLVIPFPVLDLDNRGSYSIQDISVTDGILRITDSGGTTLGTDQLVVTGDFNVANGGTVILENSIETNLQVAGSFEIGNTASFDNGSIVIELNGASATSPVFSTGNSNAVGGLLISGAADYQFNGAAIDIDGDLEVTGTGSINPLDNGYNMTISGNVTMQNTTVYNTSVDGLITLDGAAQTVAELDADELTISGTGSKSLSNVTVNDIFTIESGATAVGTGPITWENDVIINSGGSFQGANGVEYTFNGEDWIAGQNSYTNQFGTVIFNNNGGASYIRQVSNAATDSVEFHNVILRGTTNIELGRFINGAQDDGNVRMSGSMTVENTIGELRINEYLISNSATGTGTFTLQAGERIEVEGVDNFPKGFGSYAIDATSIVVYQGPFDQTVRGGFSYGNLTLNNASTSSLGADTDVNGNLNISAGSTLDATTNNYSIRVAGRWDTETGTIDGSFIARNGTVIFDGTTDQIVQIGNTGTQTFNIVQIDKTGGFVDLQTSDMVINDDLIIEDGEFDINSLEVSVGGDLDITGSGSLTSNAAGDLLFNATGGTHTIRSNSSNFLGNVTFNAPGITYTMLDNMIVDNVLTITAGTLEVNGNTLEVGDFEDVINIFGTLNVSTTANPGGTLALGNGTQLIIQAGGVINIVGTAAQTATVTRRSTGSYGFTVSGNGSPGTIGARFYTMEYMDSNGIYVDGNGAVDVTNNFSDGSFTNGIAGGTYLRIENTQDFLDAAGQAIQNIVFNDNPGGGAVNITKSVGATGTIELDNYTGEFSGESFDSDPNDLITWLVPPVLTWTGLVSTDWFNVGNWQDELGNPITNVPGTNTTTDYTSIDVVIPATPIQATLNPPVIGDELTVLEIGGNLTIEGNTLTINTADTDVDADLRITGAITLEDGTLRSLGSDDDIEIGGGITLNGSSLLLPGTGSLFTFNSTSGLVTIEPSAAFNDLIIDVVGTFNILNNLDVLGDLTITSNIGTFGFNGFDVTVSGDFVNASTSPSAIAPGTNALILTSSSPTATFNPGNIEYYNVTLGDGTSSIQYDLAGNLSLSNNLDLTNNTTLVLNGFELSAGDSNADVEVTTIDGNLTVVGGETIRFGSGTSVAVNGNLQLAGASNASRATMTRKGSSGNYSLTVNTGGVFGASFFNVSFTGGNGINMLSGSTLTVNSTGTEDVDPVVADGNDDIVLRNGTFADGAGTSYLTLANAFTTTYKADNVEFNVGPTNNVTRTGALDDLVFVDPAGSLQGPNFEVDDEFPTQSSTSGNIQWFYNNPLYTWNGGTDTDFTDDANWTTASPTTMGPGTTNTVIIPDVSGGSNTYPIVAGSVTVASLTVDANALITINDGVTVTVSGDLTNSGTITLLGTGSIEVQGALNNTGTINPGSGTITQVLTESILFNGGSSFNNLVFDANGMGPFTVTTSGSFTVGGNLTVTDNASFVINDDAHTVSVGGNFTVDEATGGAFNMTAGTFELNGTGAQVVDNTSNNAITFNRMTLSGGSTKTFNDNVTVNGELILNDNMTLLALGSTTLTLNSDLTINDGATLSSGTSTVVMSGTDVQRISGSGASTNVTFNNLSINNSTIGNSDIQLGVDTNIGGTLDFQVGIISSSASNPVIFNDDATVSYDGVAEISPAGIADADQNADGASYVTGPVLKTGDDPFVFPTGEGTRFARIGISDLDNSAAVTLAATDQYSAEYFFSRSANADATKNGDLVRVSGLEHWDLSRLVGAGQPRATLFYDEISEVNDEATLRVAHFTGGAWQDEGGTGSSQPVGTITSNNLISFSELTLATTNDATNPLPVELIYFNGAADDDVVNLDWATATELNNEKFQILHSLDGEQFDVVGEVAGQGTTNSLTEYRFVHLDATPGLNFYRLRQIDFDGTSDYSDVIQVENNSANITFNAVIYPNPGRLENLRINLSSIDRHTPVEVSILDVSGKLYFQKILSNGANGQLLGAESLVPGVYFVDVKQGNSFVRRKLVVN